VSNQCDIEGCEEPANTSSYDFKACHHHADECREWERALEAEATAEAGGPWLQKCPRRIQDGRDNGWMSQTDDPRNNPDTWNIRRQMAGGVLAKHCSYCGSLHPDQFMLMAKDEWVLGPTDKATKVYVHGKGEGSGRMESKFYFQHLSIEQRQEFVDMLNNDILAIGYPFEFYVPPFFVSYE
jgi:hypothetical protein